MAQQKPWNARPAAKPTTITEAARRYHACAQALANTLGLSLAEVLAQHRESVTAVFIECSKCEVRLPAGVQLPHVMREPPQPAPSTDSAEFSLHASENPGGRPPTPDSQAKEGTNGDPRPQTIPLDAGLPCGGLAIADLKAGQLSMLLSKTASLVHAEGDTWVPLLAALQAEKARRQAPGRTSPVVPPPDAAEEAHALDAITKAMAPITAGAETAMPDREVDEQRRFGNLSRRSMRVGLLPSVWEALRAGPYEAAERVILALEQAPVADTPAGRA